MNEDVYLINAISQFCRPVIFTYATQGILLAGDNVTVADFRTAVQLQFGLVSVQTIVWLKLHCFLRNYSCKIPTEAATELKLKLNCNWTMTGLQFWNQPEYKRAKAAKNLLFWSLDFLLTPTQPDVHIKMSHLIPSRSVITVPENVKYERVSWIRERTLLRAEWNRWVGRWSVTKVTG